VSKFYVLMKRIAVVDNEPDDITNVLKKGLERNGFTVKHL
jgi:hypothetical protein